MRSSAIVNNEASGEKGNADHTLGSDGEGKVHIPSFPFVCW